MGKSAVQLTHAFGDICRRLADSARIMANVIKIDSCNAIEDCTQMLIKLYDIISGKAKSKESIFVMIEHANQSRRYRDALMADGHDSVEVREEMKLIEPMIKKNVQQYADVVLTALSHESEDLQKMFHRALKYHE